MKHLLILIILISTNVSAFGGERLNGTWEGFLSGYYNQLGYMKLHISKKNCFFIFTKKSIPERVEFPCSSIQEKEGLFSLTTKAPFPNGGGWLERKYIFGLGPHAKGQKVSRNLIGSRIRGMRSDEGNELKILNASFFTLQEVLGNSMLESVKSLSGESANKSLKIDSAKESLTN